MQLVDTNILSELMRPQPDAAGHIGGDGQALVALHKGIEPREQAGGGVPAQAEHDLVHGHSRDGEARIHRFAPLQPGQHARVAEGKESDPKLSPLLALPLMGLHYASGMLSRLMAR